MSGFPKLYDSPMPAANGGCPPLLHVRSGAPSARVSVAMGWQRSSDDAVETGKMPEGQNSLAAPPQGGFEPTLPVFCRAANDRFADF